ncbi:MAG: amidohydrolase family protein [Caldilineaceae bacterium]
MAGRWCWANVAQGDVLIRDETIAAIGDLRDVAADTVIDAGGLLVLPGGVDTHVHFNDVFMNTVSVHDYASGTRAAAFGGTTSVIDFSNQEPGATLLSTLDAKHAEADGKALIDWGVHPVITQPTDATLAEIPLVVDAGSTTIKIYMTYRQEGLLIEEPEMRRILAGLRDAGGMMLVHAEDNDMAEASIPGFLARGQTAPIFHAESKPKAVENRAMERCIDVVRAVGGRLFVVHMTTSEGVEMIAAAGEAWTSSPKPVPTTWSSPTTCCAGPTASSGSARRRCVDKPIRTRSGRAGATAASSRSPPTARPIRGGDLLRAGPLRPRVPTACRASSPAFSCSTPKRGKGRLSLPASWRSWPATRRASSACRARRAAARLRRRHRAARPHGQVDHGPGQLPFAQRLHAYEGRAITGKIARIFSRGQLIVDGNACLAEPGRRRYLKRVLPQ